MHTEKLPVRWLMVKEAMEALGGKTTNIALRDWILDKYPGTKPSSISTEVTALTVNHDSRIHYAYAKKPRIANGKYDLLYRSGHGELELYDPKKHGTWEIRQRDEDGKLVVGLVGEIEDEPALSNSGGAFAAEGHLRDFLAANLHLIEEGLELYTDPQGLPGIEYRMELGRIDILAIDKNDGFVVIELKLGKSPDDVSGQIMRYTNWVRIHLAAGKRVRGIVIATHIPLKVKYALAGLPHISFKEYDLRLDLKDVEPVQLVSAGVN